MKRPRHVYAVTGLAPEWQAYAMAKYSRSAQSLADSARELTGDRTRKFLNSMYFKYGHASIADMAHVSLGIEQVSLWAAIVLLDEQLWDGQERSTRYQPFRETGFVVPDGAPPDFETQAEQLMGRYEQSFAHWLEQLKGEHPCPEGVRPTEYESALRARAFDIARYYLFLGVNTSVGQITSARVLERQISRMLANPLPELRSLGHDMKSSAVDQEPFHLESERLASLVEGLPEPQRSQFLEQIRPEPVAPTLIKYVQPTPYQQVVWLDVAEIANRLLSGMEPDNRSPVVLTAEENPIEAAVAALLYRVSDLAYHQIVERVARMSAGERRDLLDTALQRRGSHDEWLREFQGAPLVFDILMDIGGYRDLHRHRRSSQIRQAWTPRHGAAVPEPMQGLPEESVYLADMERAAAAVQRLQAWDPLQAQYLLPLGFRCRSLFRMDLAEAGYIIRLRSKEGGHFSYRRVAYQMYQALSEAYPEFASYLAVTDPAQDDLFKR